MRVLCPNCGSQFLTSLEKAYKNPPCPACSKPAAADPPNPPKPKPKGKGATEKKG